MRPTHRSITTGLGWVVVGVGLVWCWWQIRWLGDVRLRLPAFYAWYAGAFGWYLAGLWLVRRLEGRLSARWTAAALGVVIVAASAARGVLLPTTPTLSNDIYRYQWDGRVQRHGFDPYASAPNDPRLAFLQDEQFPHINFPHLRTVYPPMTQLAFRLGAFLGGSLTAHKLVFVGAELLLIGALLFILWRRRQSPLWVAAYAWHPLVILEISGSGHNDALGIAMLWLGLAAWEARWWLGASTGFAASCLSKFVSLLLIPWWWMQRKPRRWLFVFLALAGLPMLMHPTILSALVESFTAMTTRGASNASLYVVLAWVIRRADVAFLAALLLGGAFAIWWARRQPDVISYLVGVMAAAALLSPALHPWYVVWLVPCFCFDRSQSLMALSGLVALAYAVWPGYLLEGRWELPVWASVVEYVPVAVLGLWEVSRCRWGLSSRLVTKPTYSVAS
ncbi:MAG TPA: hypothetical protein DDX89_04855 [Candidatus Omnitrophica bacterium]|nr:MAG: hypothetical protein A2Z92_06215 [Omnitrophica WOR_2 bacterium GWA2_63_20]OGX17600.1 MAG: hypothetical protein A2105_02820 [Omnitrophica WOR_2 bacterium GWF2_63_9]OGX36450.1 MAG: hypothetical protein A3B73_01055 [Omnitrophica WOR_2 bacterium RIFCSPHIGHO2_02_FULL_63_39]OGX44847.1 MAG: hypothetical protein A3I71_04280 [Omnitrophica WOR_2 bacterium RIFCSPLOWO2_02_FULL_63_16]OGX48078.1 MAG: hypothetical protein A3G88_01940 [Omnitrophica WOR_2 bacterium RIFCSPLOWO2_12_FULL_63_16]HBH97106.1 